MRLVLLALLAAAAPAHALEVLEAGPLVLEGPEGATVERAVLLDLWDEGEPASSYTLHLAPDHDAEGSLRASLHPARANASWRPVEEVRTVAGPEPAARDRGWDGLYVLALRADLPSGTARVAVLLVEEPPGAQALAVTTELRGSPLSPRADEGAPERASLRIPPDAPAAAFAEGASAPVLPISLGLAAAVGLALWAWRRRPPGIK